MKSLHDTMKPLLTVNSAAEVLGIEPGTLYRWIENKSIPVVKLGRRIRFRQSDLQDFIDSCVRREDTNLKSKPRRLKVISTGRKEAWEN